MTFDTNVPQNEVVVQQSFEPQKDNLILLMPVV
jgi:hypothetical protein